MLDLKNARFVSVATAQVDEIRNSWGDTKEYVYIRSRARTAYIFFRRVFLLTITSMRDSICLAYKSYVGDGERMSMLL
jgi:hypothetical protein